MAVHWKPLPLDPFTPEQQPHIAALNQRLRDVFGLEGALRSPRTSRRSDKSVVRHDQPQVDVSRVTPAISQVVSGQSTVVGTPQLTLGTANTIGTTTTALSINSAIALFGIQAPLGDTGSAAIGTSAFAARADHRHQLSDTLLSTANATTLVLTDDGTQQTLTGSLGSMNFVPPAAATNVGWVFRPNQATNLGTGISVFLDADSGNRTGMAPNWAAGSLASTTIRCWDAIFSNYAGGLTSSSIIGYDTSNFSITPSAGGDTSNKAYCIRTSGPVINNAVGGWTEIAGILTEAPRRLLNNPTVTAAYGHKIECPTLCGTTQAGLYIAQRTAQHNATNRYGIFVEVQNSGTNRYSMYLAGDTAFIGGNLKHSGTALGLYGVTPTTQYGVTGTQNGFASGTSTAVTVDSTFTGNTGTLAYTLGDAIFALKKLGALAY